MKVGCIYLCISGFDDPPTKNDSADRVTYNVLEGKVVDIVGGSSVSVNTDSFKWLVKSDSDNKTIIIFIRSKEGAHIYSQRLLIDAAEKIITTEILTWNDCWQRSLICYPLINCMLPYLYSIENIGLMFHSASVKIKDNVYLFLGVSGAGKSTISQLFNEVSQNKKLTVINDERNVLVLKSYHIYGIGEGGSAGFHSQETGLLCRILFLEQADSCSLITISPSAAFLRLQQVYFAPYGIQYLIEQSVEELINLTNRVPMHVLKFSNSRETPEWFIKNVVNAKL